MMKILYVVSGTRMVGGASKSFLAMLQQADAAGIEYQVVCPDNEGIARHLKQKGIKIHTRNYRHCSLPPLNGLSDIVKWMPRLIHNSWINRKAKKELLQEVMDFRPDIIHENSSAVNIGYYLATKLDVPYIMHIREYGWLDFKLIIPDFRRRVNDKRTYTISITQDLQRHKKLLSHPRAVQIYNGIMSSSQIRYCEEKSDYFLYAGRLEPGKGISDLLKVYPEYARGEENPLRLLIAGGSDHPEFEAKIKETASASGFGHLIEWLGVRTDLPDLMYSAVATVIPSRFEGLGRVMPEAMTNGCLCIGRNTGGTKEQMDMGLALTGEEIAFRYDTDTQLPEILKDITKTARSGSTFKEGGEYYKMINRSMQSVTNYFSVERYRENLTKLYERIII